MRFFRALPALCLLVSFANAQDLPKLLRPVSELATRSARIAPARQGLEVRRSRFAEIDQNAFLQPVEGQRKISLELFTDARFEAVEKQGFWSEDQSTYLWVGKIDGMERGHVVIAATGDIVSANVNTDSGDFYWIRQVEGKLHSVQQVRSTRRMIDNDAVRVPDLGGDPFENLQNLIATKASEKAANTARDATSFVDLFVAYTPAAKNAAGGVSGIQNRIMMSVTETNLAYVNSNVNILLHLTGMAETNYNESAGIDQALDDLQGKTDGKMDELHATRDQYGADIVVLMIDKQGPSGGTVGLAYLMQNVSTSFASYAFGVVEQYWSTGPYYTFSHEVGHIFGSEHDRANAAWRGAYPYSYGYQHEVPGNPFITIMAYDCNTLNCPVIPYYSNPTVNYNTSPTGVASNQNNSADNAQSHNNTAPTLAQFRTSAGGCTFSLNPTSNSIAAGGGTGSVAITAGSGCSWTATPNAAWISITSGSSGSGNGSTGYSVTANTGAARTGTITIGTQIFTINQASGSNCTYSISPQNASYGANGGSGSIGITAAAGCAWTASTSDSFLTINTGLSGTGNGNVTYTVSSNPGIARTGSINAAGQGFTVNQSAGGSGITSTISTTPAGLSITVDNVTYIAPQTFNWTAGTQHTLSANAQGSGTRYAFVNWSNSGAATQTITAPSISTTYTATFKTQYQLATTISPSNGGTLAFTPSSDGYYDPGASVSVKANPASGFNFFSWTGAVIGSVNPVTITLDTPKTLTANFGSASNGITITTNPTGRSITVDGQQYTAPQTFQWDIGTFHQVETTATQTAFGSKFAFTAWSDGGGMSHGLTVVPGLNIYTASFSVAHQLTTLVAPTSGGTVATFPPSTGGYYAAGTSVQLVATSASGYLFGNWTGDASGGSATITVNMNNPRAINANFSPAQVCTFSLSPATVSVLASGDMPQVNVNAPAGCSWTANPSANWLTIVSGNNGVGPGKVRLKVDPNTAAARTGTVMIAGINFAVNQSAPDCTFTLSGPSTTLGPAAGSYTFNVATNAGCTWTASGSPPWITFSGASNGVGGGTFTISVTANTDISPRAGSVIVGGQWLPILQKSSQLGQQFNDVAMSYLFSDFISVLKLNNITPGCAGNPNLYCPDTTMTRAEMAAFIIRALYGETFGYTLSPYFTDVPASSDYFKYIQKMKDLGITSGCTTTTYCPTEPVTRGQMAAFLVRARMGVSNVQTFPFSNIPYFTDVPSTHLFFPFIQKMKELGITAGCTTTTYCSDDPNTRGQMAVFVTRNFF